MKTTVHIKALLLALILFSSPAKAQKSKIAVLDIDAVGGKYSTEYFIFSNELSSSNLFEILETGQIDKILKKQNVKVRSPYELGRMLSVEKLIVFSVSKQGFGATCYISGLDIPAKTKIFDDSIRAANPQQTNLALKTTARRSAYKLNNIEITEEIEQQINQDISREKQSIDEHIRQTGEGRSYTRPYKIPAYAAMVAGFGMAITGLIFDNNALEAISSRDAAYSEYCTAITGIDELWDAVLGYQKDAKNYVKKRNYAYASSAVLLAGGAYLYTITKKPGKTGVVLGSNSISIVYNF